LDYLLDRNALALLTVDEGLYGAWQADLDEWNQLPGRTLVVVPEPASVAVMGLAWLAALCQRRHGLGSVAAGED
jgi:hypothetical protein